MLGPSLTSVATDDVEMYWVDAAETAGTRTPRGSIDGQDADAESLYYADARSYANNSVNSLAVPVTTGPTFPPAGPIFPPGQGGNMVSTRQSTSSSEIDRRSTDTYTQKPTMKDDMERNTSKITSHGPIDTPTLESYQEGPEDTLARLPKLDIVVATSALVNREAASQNFPLQQTTGDRMIPSQTEQAATEAIMRDPYLLRASTSRGPNSPAHDNASIVTRVPSPDILGKEMNRKPGTPSLVKHEQGSTIGEVKDSSKKGKKGKKGKESDVKVNPEDDPDLAHFTHEQKRIILAQTEMGNGNRKATYLDIYKFSTRYERIMNIVGIFAAIISGIVQPLMTVLFGNLTTAFVKYGTAVALGQNTEAASSALFSAVNRDALFLLYIGIGMFCTTYIYMATWYETFLPVNTVSIDIIA